MASRNVSRLCPFCGSLIVLDDCAIVATSAPGHGYSVAGSGSFAGDVTLAGRPGAEQGEPSEAHGGKRVLVKAKSLNRGQKLGRVFSELRPVLEQADPKLLPRRACTNCGHVLPLELDNYDAHVLAIVGLNRAGKSYFIAAALTQAVRNNSLSRFGVETFRPLDDTARRLHNEYAVPLLHEPTADAVKRGDAILTTQDGDHLSKPPLTFLVKLTGSDPFVLVTHDVSGEVLMDRTRRASAADFVARADAVVFIADPVDIIELRPFLPADVVDEIKIRSLDQGSLLEEVLTEIDMHPASRTVPLALTLSKSDLIARALGRDFGFMRPHAGTWTDEVRNVSGEVRALLQELHEEKIVQLVASHTPSSFHAVSAFDREGFKKGEAAWRNKTIRVEDPLGTVLEQLRIVLSRAS